MRLLVRVTLFIFPLLSLSGCAFFNSFNSDLDKQVDVWMKQHEYARVLNTLKYVRPSNPKYKLLQRQRQQAITESKHYEQTQIKKALDQIEKGQWHEAKLTLKDTIEKIPQSPALDKTYREFLDQRQRYLASLYTQLDINKAEWLVKNKPVEQQLRQTLPDDNSTRQALEEFKDETRRLSPKLVQCGQQAMAIGDLQLAQHCYWLADRLQPSPALKQQLAKLQSSLKQSQKPSPPTNKSKPKISLLGSSLLEKSQQALQNGNLRLALNRYERIPDSDKQLPEVSSYGAKMHKRIHNNVTQGIELGRKLYSQGQVEQALAVWNKLRDLDPDNENLLSHIERAERVLQKIKELRQEQQSPATPKDTVNP